MIDWGFGVHLGPLDRTHMGLIREWRNDYGVFRWCRQNDLISDSRQTQWYERIQQDPTVKMYMVNSPEETPVGVAGLTSLDWANRRAEFSLYIAPSQQRRGYARKALQTLFTHGFYTLGLNCIWGESFDGNPAIGIFEALGMKPEGVRRAFYFREGRFNDAYLFSLLSTEWMARMDPGSKTPGEPVLTSSALAGQ